MVVICVFSRLMLIRASACPWTPGELATEEGVWTSDLWFPGWLKFPLHIFIRGLHGYSSKASGLLMQYYSVSELQLVLELTEQMSLFCPKGKKPMRDIQDRSYFPEYGCHQPGPLLWSDFLANGLHTSSSSFLHLILSANNKLLPLCTHGSWCRSKSRTKSRATPYLVRWLYSL